LEPVVARRATCYFSLFQLFRIVTVKPYDLSRLCR